MTQDIHCPIIHGGLNIRLTNQGITFNHCCLRNNDMTLESNPANLWNNIKLIPLREKNNNNIWDSDCWTCQGNELSNLTSFRTGSVEKYGHRKNLSGPQRLDLQFDVSCNLACRSCGPKYSTFWQKHLKDNNIEFTKQFDGKSRATEMIEILKNLDLSNLEMVVFCGGETLLGNNYWRVVEALVELVPHAKERLTISFQTNGTQSIPKHYFELIEKIHLVKLHISLDAVGDKFNYLRWPSVWEQVTANIIQLKETLPVNVMFLIEETMSIFNVYYHDELVKWVEDNYSVNRLGDVTNHTTHVAHGIFSLENLTREYVDSIKDTNLGHLVDPTWQEDSKSIANMILEIQKFDQIRNENWTKTFPEVAEFYSRYLR